MPKIFFSCYLYYGVQDDHYNPYRILIFFLYSDVLEQCVLAEERRKLTGTPGGIRTPDTQVRSLVLYPAELRVRIRLSGMAGNFFYHCRRQLSR